MAPGFYDTAVVADATWQMAYGERFALEGLLSHLRPRLALETGTAQGGSLRRIATYADEVHAFDWEPSTAALQDEIENATVHVGDSAQTLPQVLGEFAEAGRTVDFALIDGDHTAPGVQRDLRAVLESDACNDTTVVLHDTANDEVRRGLDEMDLPSHPKVRLCMLDWVPGFLVVPEHPSYGLAAWNGLGLLLLRPGDSPAQVDDIRIPVPTAYQHLRAHLQGTQAAVEPAATAPATATTQSVPDASAWSGRPQITAALAVVGGAVLGAAVTRRLRRR